MPGRCTTSPAYDVPTALLQKVKAAGFDFIRLSVDPGPFLGFTGDKLNTLNQRLLSVVAQIRQAGLDVVIDFHPISMIPSFVPQHIEWNVGGLFNSYVTMVGNTARLFLAQSDHVAIEPMNEPQLGYDSASIGRWQWMAGRLYQAARLAAPGMTIILTGCEGGGPDGLVLFKPQPFITDPNVRYSFHYYLTYMFSLQSLPDPSDAVWQYVQGLPYPASPLDFATFWTMVQERITAATNLSLTQKTQVSAQAYRELQAYFNGLGTRTAMHADFLRVIRWAATNHVPSGQIFMGEFDAVQAGPNFTGANPADRARWLTDVRLEAEAAGFRWSLWNLNDPSSNGMTLVSVADPTKLDAATLTALGKSPLP